MKEYLYDLHVHTSETSACGQVAAKDVVDSYIRAGYDGIAITDHYHGVYFDGLGNMPWPEKVHRYMGGYRAARRAAEGTDLQVLFGIEFRNRETDDDFLVYGVDEDFLAAHPELCELPLAEAIARFHEAGAMVIQAHPVRFRLGIAIGDEIFDKFTQRWMLKQLEYDREIPVVPWERRREIIGKPQCMTVMKICQLRQPELLDGIEGYNGNNHWCQDPREIEEIRRRYPHLKVTSASDFHEPAHLARAGMWFDERLREERDLVHRILSNRVCGYKTSDGVDLPRL